MATQNNAGPKPWFRSPPIIALAIGFGIALVAANWIYSIDEPIGTDERLRTAQQQAPGKFPIDNISLNLEGSYWSGGWPLKYYNRVEHPGLPPLHSLSLGRVLLNLLAWGGIAGCLAIYVRLSYRNPMRVDGPASRSIGQVKLLDLLVLLMIIAGCFGFWRQWKQQQQFEAELGKSIIAQGGMSEVQIIAPSILKRILPQSFLSVFSRLTGATLESPANEILDQVLSVAELRSLRIGGGDYDLKKLEKLRTLPHLRELRVAGRELDGAAIAAIGSCKQLLSLNLMRTNISNEGMEAISDLPRLRSLNLVHTAVSLAKIKPPNWSRTVHDLFLPHPGRNAAIDPSLGDRICEKQVVRGWPELRSIYCIEHDESENSNCVDLEIADCPRLGKISLDIFQRFDLRLSNLGELTELTAIRPQWTSRLTAGEKTGSEISVRKLDLQNLPKLVSVQVSGKGFLGRNKTPS